MQRTLGVALAAGLLLDAAVPAQSAVLHRLPALGSHRALATTGWVPTVTGALSPANALDLGAVPATMPMSVVVGLRMNRAAGDALARHIYTPGDALYHHFLRPADYKAMFAPSDANARAVAAYLTSAGLSNVRIEPNNLMVSADGTAATVTQAFDTRIDAFSQAGKAIFVNVAPAMVPASLGGIVLGVLGLQNAPMHLALPSAQERAKAQRAVGGTLARIRALRSRTASARRMAATPGVPNLPASFYANDLRTFYDAKPGDTGQNTDQAVFTEGDVSEIPSDLAHNAAQNGIPAFPLRVVQVTNQSGDTSGIGEFAMDVQASTGLAHGVHSLTLYNSSLLNDSDITRAFNRWVTDDVATVASASFGECEYQAELDGAMALDDQVFLQALLQGQTLFASSGDSGSSCGFNIITNGVPGAGPPMVEYPTTSPYVMSAGGTTLLANPDNTYDGEISWNSGGGGLSYFEPAEYWTLQAVAFQCLPVYCSLIGPGLPVALTGGAGRAVPDVAMDADFLLSAFNYYLSGAWTSNGGTSLAAPLSAGAYDIMQSAHGQQLGHAGPVYYSHYVQAGGGTGMPIPSGTALTQPVSGFNDILFGANGVWTALPGYDLTTGMGSIDLHTMASILAHS